MCAFFWSRERTASHQTKQKRATEQALAPACLITLTSNAFRCSTSTGSSGWLNSAQQLNIVLVVPSQPKPEQQSQVSLSLPSARAEPLRSPQANPKLLRGFRLISLSPAPPSTKPTPVLKRQDIRLYELSCPSGSLSAKGCFLFTFFTCSRSPSQENVPQMGVPPANVGI